MSAQEKKDVGMIRIHEGVIATIIRKTVSTVPGVARISGSSLVDNLAEIVGSRRIYDRSIVVEMGDSSVAAEVSLNLKFGCKIPETAAKAQKAVAEEITRITGLNVSRINILIREIEEPSSEENI